MKRCFHLALVTAGPQRMSVVFCSESNKMFSPLRADDEELSRNREA